MDVVAHGEEAYATGEGAILVAARRGREPSASSPAARDGRRA